ncbi:MAG TPA: methylated-DNA--[protein]-cysteine S-methyltransferase [Acidimicrobiia bacterium]|jgi:methylated-DNA-[protein]-cysteine S-methyltransferase|nr:methylated-DNA--[protein]-cysteine S-methyltransferase [Acidimicrobiia bacterium]
MTNADLSDLEAALRRGSTADLAAPADAATRAAIAAADRAGLVDVAIGSVDSPVGELFVAVTARGLVRLAFDPEQLRVLDDLAARISPRVVEAASRVDPVRRELDEYFAGRRRRFDLPVDLSLTSAWGRRVLEATARVPAGQVTTYGALAAKVGKPSAARAVGNAVATNPVAIVVPCHRVVPAGGGVGNYGGGPERKAFLLELERE